MISWGTAVRIAMALAPDGDLDEQARAVIRIAFDGEEPVGRTPETVLRAMLRAYTDAAVAAEAEVLRASDPTLMQQARYYNAMDAEANMRSSLAQFLADGEIVPWLTERTDYEARLSGARPLDAPPMEEP